MVYFTDSHAVMVIGILGNPLIHPHRKEFFANFFFLFI